MEKSWRCSPWDFLGHKQIRQVKFINSELARALQPEMMFANQTHSQEEKEKKPLQATKENTKEANSEI